jgi:large subunit ribosomal protein L9
MANKLLLLEDVDALGRKGDIVSVRPGYARNFLLPQGIAIVANANALRMQNKLQEERKKQAAIDKKEADELAANITGITLIATVKIDHEGHMYGSVSALDIVHLLKDQTGFELERRAVQLPQPIKETGVHDIKVKLKEGVATTFTLKVIPEGGALEEAPAAEAQK